MKSNVAPKADTAQFRMFLRIKHPTIDPNEITQMLGLEPEQALQAGQAIPRSGTQRAHHESYWIAPLAIPAREDLVKNWRSMLPQVRGPRTPKTAAFLDALPKSSPEQPSLTKFALGFEGVIMLWLRLLNERREFFHRINQEAGRSLCWRCRNLA